MCSLTNFFCKRAKLIYSKCNSRLEEGSEYNKTQTVKGRAFRESVREGKEWGFLKENICFIFFLVFYLCAVDVVMGGGM